MAEEFDLEAALRNVQSAGGQRPKSVERAHVFLPKQMRADLQPAKPVPTKKTVPWFVKQSDWSKLGKSVQTSAPTQPEDGQQLSLPTAPAGRRMFGCSICGSKTVLCKDDGSPYDHKCKHKQWCKTKSGHPVCEECEKELLVRVEQDQIRKSHVRRQFAANVRKAEKNALKVGFDLVEVTRPMTCPLCQRFLQGNRAVRVWVQEDGEWVVNNVQCTSHHRPGVPLSERCREKSEQPDE
jgi:RNase P subunit RPR2